MRKLAGWVVRNRKTVYLIVVIITIASLPGIKRLKIESDLLKTLPPDDPVVKAFNEVGKTFKGNFIGIVVFDASPNVFREEILKKIEEISNEYSEIEGISDVISIVNAMDIKKIPEGIEVGPLLREIPQSKDSLEKFKDYILSKERYVGTFVSNDARYTAIFLRFKTGIDKGEVAEKVIEITEKNKGDLKVYYGGFPLQIVFVSRLINEELARLTPLAALILALILAVSFLNFKGVILPLATSLIAIIWTLGLMGYMGKPLSIVSDIIPVILLAVGSAYAIHMFNRIEEEGQEETDVKRALSKVGIPITLTALTTFAGFISLLSADLMSVRDFGLFTSIGVIFALFLSLFLVPAISLSLKGKKARRDEFPYIKTPSFIIKLSQKKNLALVIFGFLILLSILGFPKITREVNMLDYFKKDNPIRVSAEIIIDEFGGSNPIQIYSEGDVKDPAFLKILKFLEEEIGAVENVEHPLSIADLICEMNELLVGYYSIPETKEEISNLWILLEGQSQLETMVSGDERKAIIQARVSTIETEKMKEITKKIDMILKSLPTEWILDDRDKFEDSLLYDSLISFESNLTARRISLLLGRKEDSRLREAIKKFLKNGFQLDTIVFSKVLKEKIIAYLESEEADIYIDSPELREKLTENLVPLLLNKKVGKKDVINITERVLPPQLVEDREGIELLSEKMISIAKDVRKELLIESLLMEIGKFISDPPSENKLKGILSDLFGEKILIPLNLIQIKKNPEGKTTSIEMRQTGLPLIYRRLDERLLRSQAQSLLLALFLVFIMMTILFRSIKGGLLAITPIVFTIIFNFGFMGFTGIALDNATVMVAPIAIGIGIDYSIHILSRLKEEKKSKRHAVSIALKSTGRAVLINAFSVGSGFAVLLLANIVPLQRFGVLIALTMFVSTLAALILIPTLYEKRVD